MQLSFIGRINESLISGAAVRPMTDNLVAAPLTPSRPLSPGSLAFAQTVDEAVAPQVLDPAPPAPQGAAPAEASAGRQMLGRMGAQQQRYLHAQQTVGAVSQLFGARMSVIGQGLGSVWRHLRGTDEAA